MRLSDKISGSLSSKYDNSILAALNESYETEKLIEEIDNKSILKLKLDYENTDNHRTYYTASYNNKELKFVILHNQYNEIYTATQTGEPEAPLKNGITVIIDNKKYITKRIGNESILEKLTNESCETEVKECDEKQDLKEEEIEPKVEWDNYEDYSEEEIEKINNLLDNANLEVIKHEGNKEEGYSVAVKDNNSGLVFWMDYLKDGQDIYGDWNQYIFHTNDSRDRIRQAMQSAYTDDWSFFMDVEDVGMQYLRDKGLISDSEDGMIFESCETKLDEDIKDDTAQAAKQIALEIQERGIMGFEEVDNMAADILGVTLDELRNQELDTDIYISLNYEGIDNNMSTGDFYTQEYAEEHPEVLEESEKQTLNETDATPEFLEDLKNLINNHMRVDKIASMELQEDNETGNEIVVITFENGGIVRENVTGDSNLAMARAILFRLA